MIRMTTVYCDCYCDCYGEQCEDFSSQPLLSRLWQVRWRCRRRGFFRSVFSGEIHWCWFVPDERDSVSDTILELSTYCRPTFSIINISLVFKFLTVGNSNFKILGIRSSSMHPGFKFRCQLLSKILLFFWIMILILASGHIATATIRFTMSMWTSSANHKRHQKSQDQEPIHLHLSRPPNDNPEWTERPKWTISWVRVLKAYTPS